MSDIELLSAGMSAVLGTKVVPRDSVRSRRDSMFLPISAKDFVCQTYPIMRPIIRPADLDEPFDLTVTYLAKATKTIRVSGKSTIAEAKTAVARYAGLSEDQIQLLYSGKRLDDSRVVNDYGIRPDEAISWVPCLPGGGHALSYVFDPNDFEFKYNYDFTNVKQDGKKYMRGGYEYERPYGWKRFGIKVLGEYEDDNWLGPNGLRTDQADGEWPVSYHGTNVTGIKNILKTGFKAGPRDMYGKGIYTSPSVEMVAQYYSEEFTLHGKTYKLVLQNRVNPKNLKIIPASHTIPGVEYWLSPERQQIVDVRPYGVLVREEKSFCSLQ